MKPCWPVGHAVGQSKKNKDEEHKAMEKTNDMPIWVYLAFSSIEARRTALILIGASALFTLYCIPWVTLAEMPEWVGKVFRIDDWSWFAMMVPMTIWYWLALRWVDKNAGWKLPE